MKPKIQNKQINLRVSEELNQWYEATAQELGMSKNALMIFALQSAKTGTQALLDASRIGVVKVSHKHFKGD